MRYISKIPVLLGIALIFTGISFAQATATKASGPAAAPAAPPPPEVALGPQEGGGSSDDSPHTVPVFWISSIEVLRSAHGPQLDVVRVRARTSTDGWESAVLVPLTKGTPADGILDLLLIAEAPGDNTAPTSYPEIEAIFAIEPGHPFKGVRVHGAANRLVLKTFPGFVESGPAPRDCVGCTGKVFVAKGTTAPAGSTPDKIVREEDLPKNLRVIRESDGIGSLESDPNRMTLLLNEKNEIINALWD